MSQQKIHIVCGPTASGKSALAMALAEKSGGVIINADSQQVYRELRILTARPSEAEEARLPHRLYGFLSVSESCSAGVWLAHARMEIDWCLSQGQMPIVVGGTGLYLKALMEGIAEIPEVPEIFRAQASADHAAMGGEAFRTRLREVDPVLGERLRPSDRQRLIRAWEVWLATGKPLSYWQSHRKNSYYKKELFDIVKVIPERTELYRRIDTRVLQMVENGAVEEVKALPSLEPPPPIIGVAEITAYLNGETTWEAAIALLQQRTRHYAKRQLTWFRHQLG